MKKDDKSFTNINDKYISILRDSLYFLIPFIIGFIIKIIIFNIAAVSEYPDFFTGDPSSDALLSIQNIEYYNDFNFYTTGFVNAFLSGKLPYTHYFHVGSVPNDFMTYSPYLIYPPLYLYIVSMFGNNPVWVIALPILIFDSITALFVYLITHKIWKNKVSASIASLIYLLNPLTLYYSEYAWLNTSIFTLFLVISIYFLIDDRFYLSIFALSLSLMCKQFAGILLPIILIRFFRKMQDKKLGFFTKFKKFLLVMLFFILPIGLLSLPYILPFYPDFPDYLFHIFAMGGFEFDLNLPLYAVPIDFVVPFIALNFNYNILFGLKTLTEFYVLLIGSSVIICCIYSFFIKRNKSYNKNTIIISLILLISLTLFFPRGFYKYYCVVLIPLMSMFIMKNLKNYGWTHWKRNSTEVITDIISIVIYYIFSISILFIHRYFTPIILLSMIGYYTFYGYINFSSLLRKYFRIYSKLINTIYDKQKDKVKF